MYVSILVINDGELIQKWPGKITKEVVERRKKYLLHTDLLIATNFPIKLVGAQNNEFVVELKILGKDPKAKTYPWVYEITKSAPQINF